MTLQDVINGFYPAKNGVAVIAEIDGVPIQTVSGKSSWRTVGAAKNAINNHLSSYKGWPYLREHNMSASDLRIELEKSNRLTYKTLK